MIQIETCQMNRKYPGSCIQVVKPEPGEITESGNIIENGDEDELHSQVNLIYF